MVQVQPKQSTRERIIDTALDVFAELGFTGTTVSEIERRVGLTAGSGSFYRHFPSKQALLKVAAEREVQRVRQEIADAVADMPDATDPEDRRVKDFELRLHSLTRADRLFRLMLNEGHRVPELREAISAAVQPPASRGAEDDWEGLRLTIAMAALGGYYLFSTMQGRPFNGIGEQSFIHGLVEMTDAIEK